MPDAPVLWPAPMTRARWMALGFAARTALAALLALWVAMWVGLPMPYWAMTTTFIVASPLSGATRSKAIYRVIGTVIGAAVAVALVPALVEWPLLLSLALALWSGGALAVSLLDRSPRAYTMMLAGYSALMVGVPAIDRPEAVFDIGAARVTEIVLGITCATLAHSLLWPQSVGAALAPRLRAWLADAQAWRENALHGAGPQATERARRALAVDAMDCAILATHVPFDTSHWREASASVQALLRRMLLLLPLLSGLSDRHAALDERAAQGAPDGVWAALLRESHAVRARQAARVLDECEALLAHIDDPALPTPMTAAERARPITLHADVGFALLSGLAATMSILLCCAIWILTGWADGGVAALMAGVFCALFAAMDNPVPMMLRFGGAMMGALPVAALYLFVLLPAVDGFVALALLLLPATLVAGLIMAHPRHGPVGAAAMMGFANALALQETFQADFARFFNANLGQVLGLMVAVGVTASIRTIGADAAIARLNGRLRRDLVGLARAVSPPDRVGVLGRATDRLALITQRLGDEADGTDGAALGLHEVRVAMNIVTLQHVRPHVERKLRLALERVLRDVATGFERSDRQMPPRLLPRLDTAMRLMIANPESWDIPGEDILTGSPSEGLAALVALRRNLFPDAPDFVAETPA
ncbi:FUSC family protein [Novosphingobium sp.]|uniref:FUSC family protein n=1 Tax=Novosphingobium sp. TaxID=1874826 RepID=UPI0038BD2D62